MNYFSATFQTQGNILIEKYTQVGSLMEFPGKFVLKIWSTAGLKSHSIKSIFPRHLILRIFRPIFTVFNSHGQNFVDSSLISRSRNSIKRNSRRSRTTTLKESSSKLTQFISCGTRIQINIINLIFNQYLARISIQTDNI